MKNTVLKTSASIAFLTGIVSACMVDSSSWIPTVVCLVSFAYLALFARANNWFYDEYMWGEDEW